RLQPIRELERYAGVHVEALHQRVRLDPAVVRVGGPEVVGAPLADPARRADGRLAYPTEPIEVLARIYHPHRSLVGEHPLGEAVLVRCPVAGRRGSQARVAGLAPTAVGLGESVAVVTVRPRRVGGLFPGEDRRLQTQTRGERETGGRASRAR